MRAVIQHEFGRPDVLRVEEVDKPAAIATEILVKVHAIGVNPVEAFIRSGGFPLLGPPPFILGWEVSGVVEHSVPGPGRFREGDEVYGLSMFPRPGNAYAEYIAGPSRMFARKPASLDHLHAAALPLVGLTAYQGMIEYAAVSGGQTVLIHGGGGGVGHVAVQLAKAHGARVIATASAGKASFVRDLGADEVIDYAAVDFADVVRDVDLVFDLIGGSVGERSLGVLRPGGTLLTSVQHSDPVFRARVEDAGFRFVGVAVEPDAPALSTLASLVDAGKLRVHVEHALPLEEASKAHELIETGHTRGKIVLVP
jgi:NADPH:quinone reductase-like Zn-dependent oxidoreductase